MTRKPAVAGQFYPADRAELGREVSGYLFRKKQAVKAGILPHAGYSFSGKLAGGVVGRMPEKKIFIILGVNHAGSGSKISLSSEDFETPLGIVKINKKLVEGLMRDFGTAGIECSVNETAHEQEHSIEVILPFLQKSQKQFEIVPILLKDLSYDECKQTAELLSEFLTKDVCILVSSDFTHYGRNYGFVLPGDIKKNIYKIDEDLINSILNRNPEEVYEKAKNSTVCGLYGLTIVTEIAKMNKWKGKLLNYYTSGDIMGYEEGIAVGYAGIVFS